MINNTIPVCQALEIEDPKAAAVCAVEVLNPSMQPTLDAASLAIMSQRGQFKGITVDGPLALDNALNEDAARHKGIKSPVAGQKTYTTLDPLTIINCRVINLFTQ